MTNSHINLRSLTPAGALLASAAFLWICPIHRLIAAEPSIVIKEGATNRFVLDNGGATVSQVVAFLGQPDQYFLPMVLPIKNSIITPLILVYQSHGLIVRFQKEGLSDDLVIQDVLYFKREATLMDRIIKKSELAIELNFPIKALRDIEVLRDYVGDNVLQNKTAAVFFWNILSDPMVTKITKDSGLELHEVYTFKPDWEGRKTISTYVKNYSWEINYVLNASGDTEFIRFGYYRRIKVPIFEQQLEIRKWIQSREKQDGAGPNPK